VVIHTARLQVPYETHDADIVALLRSGKNVITTAGDHYPQPTAPKRAALFEQAGLDGGATLYGVGMNPGFLLERLVLGLTGVCVELESVDVRRDARRLHDARSRFVFNVMGMGSDPPPLTSQRDRSPCSRQLYAEAIRFFGDRTGTTFERIQADTGVAGHPRPGGQAGVIPPARWRQPSGAGTASQTESGS